MPIRMSCPKCQAAYDCPDDSRGKSLRCKKCETVFKVQEPATEPPSSPPAVETAPRKNVAAPAVRTAKGAKDPVPGAPARWRAADDAPVGKSRRSARRADEEGEKPKKGGGGALKWVLGILGGLFLVCGGSCGGVYWFVIKPVYEKGKQAVEEVKHGLANDKVTAANARSIRQGMTAAEVEAIFGKGAAADLGELSVSVIGADRPEQGQETVKRWEPKVKEGAVLVWRNLPDTVLVAYSTPPDKGGKVVGVLANFSEGQAKGKVTEFVRLPPTSGGDPDPDDRTPVAVLTADEFIDKADMYRTKVVTVKGNINRLFVFPDGKIAQLGLASTRGKQISCDFDKWSQGLAAEGDGVEVTGRVVAVEMTIINLRQCELVKRR